MAKIKAFGAAISVASNDIGGVNTISISESESADIDVTTHDSTAKEFLGGLTDFGTVTISGKYNISDTGQAYLRNADNQGGAAVACEITFSDDSTASFNAVLKGFGVEVEDVDGTVNFTATLKVSGAITYAA